ncbi:unnamed protein product [Anisakis simplex]|uniref:Fibrous sheath CABYR-binding protein-like n=1 Tax=Anisakis simplex TaxID=6269 RepID=A0A0M3KDS3_ANISI|nr:unnamed protein product [Anisakis simplex]
MYITFAVVEREQLAEETPILYSLTVSDTSPLPRQKDAVEENEHQSKVVVATKAAGGDENKGGTQLESTALQTVPAESTAITAQEKDKEDEKMEVDSTTPTEGQEESTVNTPPTSTSPAQETAEAVPEAQAQAQATEPTPESTVVSNQEATPTTQVNCASQEATSDSSATETKAPEQEAKMPESTTPTVNEANSTERVD